MEDNTEVILTADGSHSLLNRKMNETYHSVHGAVQESNHVYIEAGLDYVLRHFTTEIKILEVGFGTGLNALLTLQHGLTHHHRYQYTTLEAFPLSEAIWRQLNYGGSLNLSHEFFQMHELPWESWQQVTPDFRLLKQKVKVQDSIVPERDYHLVYFDAFAPSKQPEMWDIAVLRKVTDGLLENGALVTYCARGQLKRDLQSLGLTVETLPGPPGKKEMVRAVRSGTR